MDAGPSGFEAGDHTRLWLQSKLSGEWSAQSAAGSLTEERLTTLTRVFSTLDTMVKVRLLLAGLFVPRADRPRLQPLLSDLAHQALSSQDEWVRATAAAVGDFSGPLDMAALVAHFPLARDTLAGLGAQLVGLHTPAALLPQTEQYMHADLCRLRPPPHTPAPPASAHAPAPGAHFRLRDPPLTALTDLGLGATGTAHPTAGNGAGAQLHGQGHGGGPGAQGAAPGLDGRPSLGGGLPGPGGDPLARRGLGGGETSVLRSRTDISHKLLNQVPPTPGAKSGPAAPAAGLAMRPSRPRPQLATDWPAASASGADGLLPSPSGQLQQPPGGWAHGAPTPLGRRDSASAPWSAGWPGGAGTPVGGAPQRGGSLPASAPAGGAAYGGGFGGGAPTPGAAAARASSTAVGVDEMAGPEPRGELAPQHRPPEGSRPPQEPQQPQQPGLSGHPPAQPGRQHAPQPGDAGTSQAVWEGVGAGDVGGGGDREEGEEEGEAEPAAKRPRGFE